MVLDNVPGTEPAKGADGVPPEEGKPDIVSKPVPLLPPRPQTIEDFMKQYPDFKSYMEMSIAMEICQKMKKDNDRIKKMKKEYEREG